MALESTGKIIQIQPQESGVGKNGTWVKQNIVIETNEQFPKKICLQLWGDKVEQAKDYKVGNLLKVTAAVESREYNGKWYTDVRPFRIELAERDNTKPEENSNTETDDFDLLMPNNDELSDDLPF